MQRLAAARASNQACVAPSFASEISAFILDLGRALTGDRPLLVPFAVYFPIPLVTDVTALHPLYA